MMQRNEVGASTHGFANAVLGGTGLYIFLAWHLAVAATVDQVGFTDLTTTLRALVHLEPIAGLPGSSPGGGTVALFGVLLVVLGAVSLALVLWAIRVRGRFSKDRSQAGMATRRGADDALGERRARESAAQTRPGMSEKIRKQVALSELSLRVGRPKGSKSDVYLSLQDHLAVIAPTGGGKSVYVMAPAALTAPGALVVTSNEVSILDLVATTRAKRGRLWVFDPLGRSAWPEPMVWNPVKGCEDGATALARGVAFAAGLRSDSGSTNSGFFQKNAMIALSRMLHAAALSGRDMSEVLRWATNLDRDGKVAASLIRASTDDRVEPSWAAMLDGVSTGADETVASSRQTLQQAVEPLTLRKVTRWVTPAEGVPEFDAEAFVTSTDTLVLISDDSSSTNVGPLCTMLFQEVMDAIKALAPLSDHGKLDPPMRVVGDEIANVAPIDKLPELASEVRKLGVQLVLAFQSEQQLRSRWGDRGNTLLEQMSAELVLPGLKSTASLKRYGDLTGRAEVDQHTVSFGDGGEVRGGSTSEQLREVMRSDEVRQLENGTALLIYRNAAPMILQMTAWFETPQADTLTRDARTVAKRRHDHATDSGESVAVGGAVDE